MEAATTPKPSSSVKSSENPETRLQVRTSKGAITKTFPSDSSEFHPQYVAQVKAARGSDNAEILLALVDVAEWVCSEDISYDVNTVRFASTFPRKTYGESEMKRTLKDNGLTPSAVLMASSSSA